MINPCSTSTLWSSALQALHLLIPELDLPPTIGFLPSPPHPSTSAIYRPLIWNGCCLGDLIST
jgi:hypothetical protein